MKSNGKVLFALLAGAAAGAALGLLLAPGKGSESRKNIAEAAKKLVDSLGGITERFTSGSASSSGRNGNSAGSSNSPRSESTTASASQGSEASKSRAGQTAGA